MSRADRIAKRKRSWNQTPHTRQSPRRHWRDTKKTTFAYLYELGLRTGSARDLLKGRYED